MPQQFYTTLVCLGNHENYSLVEKIPQEDWRGAKVRRARENVLILERGGMYDLNGVTLWTMGGAASHDMEYRIPGIVRSAQYALFGRKDVHSLPPRIKSARPCRQKPHEPRRGGSKPLALERVKVYRGSQGITLGVL